MSPIESLAMPTRYVMMSFGADDTRYWQAHWLILGLMAHAPRPFEIVVVTDHPDYFEWFGPAVRVLGLSADELAEWIGPQGYFFRTLIKCLQAALALAPTPAAVMYLDTDTQVNRDLGPLIAELRQGAVFMDCREYPIHDSGRRGNKGARTLWAAVGDRDWLGLRVDRDTWLWNTGLTALPLADAPLVDRALALCDHLLASGVDHRLTEQVALGLVLTAAKPVREINPAGAPPWITHYWGNKAGWHRAITARLATLRHRGLDLDAAVDFAREHPIDRPRFVRRTRRWHRWLKVEPAR